MWQSLLVGSTLSLKSNIFTLGIPDRCSLSLCNPSAFHGQVWMAETKWQKQTQDRHRRGWRQGGTSDVHWRKHALSWTRDPKTGSTGMTCYVRQDSVSNFFVCVDECVWLRGIPAWICLACPRGSRYNQIRWHWERASKILLVRAPLLNAVFFYISLLLVSWLLIFFVCK